MEKRINSINIKSYRGLSELELNNLNRINVIVGDNNSGKTSLLEARMLASNSSINNAIITSVLRTKMLRAGSFFNEFINSFPKDGKKYNISMNFEFDSGNKLNYEISGNMVRTLPNPMEIPQVFNTIKVPEQLIYQFNGNLLIDYAGGKAKNDIKLNAFNCLNNRTLKNKSNIIKARYVSPVDYAGVNSLFNLIIKNDKYKEMVVRVLRIFDPFIDDLLYVVDEFGEPIESVKSSKLGVVPLTIYGDGIKKTLSIAGGIAAANKGVLLIDEFETAIHIKNYDEIFNFVNDACKQFDVQLFITTHSIEAVDELLKIDELVKESEINFITLRKDFENNKTISRTMSAKDVKENRKNFGFEVRL